MSGYIDPRRAAIVTEIAGMASNAEREGWLINTIDALRGEVERLKKALVKVRSYNADIQDRKMNYRPEDHIYVIDAALSPEPDGGAR